MNFKDTPMANEDPKAYARRNVWFGIKNILMLSFGGWLIVAGASSSASPILRALLIITGILFVVQARWSYELLFARRTVPKGRPRRFFYVYWKLKDPVLLAFVAIITIVAGFVDGAMTSIAVLPALSGLTLIAVAPFVIIFILFAWAGRK